MKIFICIFIAAATVQAAPYPATGSSIFSDPEKRLAFLGHGFYFSTRDTEWKPLYQDSESTFSELRFQPREPLRSSLDASILLRVDRLEGEKNLDSMARNWLKEYIHYGFEVLGHKMVQSGGGKVFIIDLLQKEKGKQLRQVVFNNDSKLVILTCTDNKDKISETLKSCNQLVRSFSWASIH